MIHKLHQLKHVKIEIVLFSYPLLFGNNSKAVISATKSMTGHLLGAAGAIEAIACIQAVQHNMIPPTINTTAIADGYDNLNVVMNKAISKEVHVAISNTFGFGGHIAALLVKKFKA